MLSSLCFREQEKQQEERRKQKSRRPDICNPMELLQNFRKFFDYRVAIAGIANSMQHLSLVSFGIVTMVYIRTQGISVFKAVIIPCSIF